MQSRSEASLYQQASCHDRVGVEGFFQLDTDDKGESREYPSRLFFMDMLLKEVQKAGESGKSLDEVLDQLRVIWTARNREAVLGQLENHLGRRRSIRFPDELQLLVANALSDLVRSAEDLGPGDRQKADLAVSRIIKYLDPPNQLDVIAPWFQESRKFRMRAVMRTLRTVEDLTPYSDYLVRQYRTYPLTEILMLIARTPDAASLISSAELDPYFSAYISSFKTGERFPNRSNKYFAMIAARVLIIGNQPIPAELLRSVPEVFSWAIEEIGDPVHEPMLIWIIVENHDNPEVLWSAIRTANRRFMPKALARGLETARQLLASDQGVLPVPPEITNRRS